MVKKTFFSEKFGGIILAALLVVGVFAGVSEAKSFSWDKDSNICFTDSTCGYIGYVWTLTYYCSVVSSDCAYDTVPYDQVPGGKGVFVPYANQPALKALNAYISKVQVIPESYDTTSIKFSKENFSALPYDTKFVFVVVAYEKSNGEVFESKFSNRVMWKTPKKLGFTIKVE